jgi:hypothetical protein
MSVVLPMPGSPTSKVSPLIARARPHSSVASASRCGAHEWRSERGAKLERRPVQPEMPVIPRHGLNNFARRHRDGIEAALLRDHQRPRINWLTISHDVLTRNESLKSICSQTAPSLRTASGAIKSDTFKIRPGAIERRPTALYL